MQTLLVELVHLRGNLGAARVAATPRWIHFDVQRRGLLGHGITLTASCFAGLTPCLAPLEQTAAHSRVLHEDVDEDGTERGLVDENPPTGELASALIVAANDIFAFGGQHVVGRSVEPVTQD